MIVALELGEGLPISVFLGLVGAFLNILIDTFGHRGLRRDPYTHSLLGVTILSCSIAVIAALSLELYIGYKMDFLATLLAILLSGYIHLFLDMLTSTGIYPIWPWSRKTFSLASIRYDDPLTNKFFSTLFILLILAEILKHIKIFK